MNKKLKDAGLPLEGLGERRTKRRFRISQDVCYKILYGRRFGETGRGRTINISSSGLWLSTETMLASRMAVELKVTWPVLLNNSCPMTLVIYGSVVHSNDKGAAVAIERYEFHTRGLSGFQQPGAASTADPRFS